MMLKFFLSKFEEVKLMIKIVLSRQKKFYLYMSSRYNRRQMIIIFVLDDQRTREKTHVESSLQTERVHAR